MRPLTFGSRYLTVEQQRLLGGWLDIMDDIKTLCRDLASLPDDCRCGNGAGHLKGTCPCCHTVTTERVPDCGDCDEQLARLRPAIDVLTVDTFRFFPFIEELLAHHTPPPLQASNATIELHIRQFIHAFGDLVVAADQFRTDCRMSHLTTLKGLATSLLKETDALNRAL